MKHVTLSDIAKKTGYSVNTVSHALHNKPDISEKTKEYIVKAAKKMGYIANASASSLRSGKSKSVAIIIGDISNPHFSIMIKEIEGRLRKHEYTAIILNTDEDEQLERIAIVSSISKGVDGIILCPVQKTTENIAFMQQSGIPFVLLGRRFETLDTNYVVCDDVNGGFAAAKHLIERGHRQLLLLHAPLHISSAHERMIGVERAAKAYGISHLRRCEVSLTENNDAILQALREHADCTGIICFSDLMAMQVCHLLKTLGKRVPQDVSVIGFDNIGSKFFFPLMLSSVTSSKTKMSEKAVDILMDGINGGKSGVQQHILPTEVIARDSTAERR